MHQQQDRKLRAILFADIAGYTAMMQENEIIARQWLQKFRETLRTKVEKFDGEIIQFYGDGCLCTFESAVNALTCASEIQQAYLSEPTVPVRIGLHSGEVFFEANNVYGDAVNIASRVESIGISGAVLLSSNVRNQIKNKPQFELVSLGRFEFKNVVEGMTVYALGNEGLAIPQKNAIKGKLKPKKSKSILWIGITGIFALVFLAFFISRMNGFQSNKVVNESPEISIAVLPLTNLNSKEENLGYFSTGVSQEIIDELAQISSLKISAFTQSSFYNTQNLAPIEIAEKLNVKYLISGTTRLFDKAQRVKLSIELFNPRTNEITWNGTFDESMDNASSIQNSIAKQVAKNLNISLTPSDLVSVNKITTTNGNAFKLYLRAKSEINKFTKEGYENTQSFLKEAIRLDSNFSNAYTLFAWSFMPSNASHWAPDIPSSLEIKKHISPLIKKAIELEANNSNAYIVKGGLRLFYDNDIRGAKSDIDRAIGLNSWPRIPTDYCICTAVATYVALEDANKAKEIAELANKIDPGNALLEWDMGNIYMVSGEFEKAANQYKIPLAKTQISSFGMFVGFAYYHAQKLDDAQHYLEIATKNQEKVSGFLIAYLSATHFKKGNQIKSDAYKLELENRLAAGENHLNWPLAIIHLSRNEVEIALDYLEESKIRNEINLALFTSLDPIFDSLMNNPRFMEIRRQMNYYELEN